VGRRNLARSWIAAATQLAFRMKIHIEEEFNLQLYGLFFLSPQENYEVVRRLAWILFTSNIYEVKFGQGVHFLSESFYQTALPRGEHVFLNHASDGPVDLSGMPGTYDAKSAISSLSSSSVFFTPLDSSYYYAHICQCTKLYRRVLTLEFKLTKSNTTIHEGQITATIDQIDAALDLFYAKLQKFQLDFTVPTNTADLETIHRYWNILYTFYFFHIMKMNLHFARFLAYEKTETEVKSTQHKDMDQILLANTEAIKTLRIFVSGNPHFLYVPILSLLLIYSHAKFAFARSILMDQESYKTEALHEMEYLSSILTQVAAARPLAQDLLMNLRKLTGFKFAPRKRLRTIFEYEVIS
jgi:hypothetical protein